MDAMVDGLIKLGVLLAVAAILYALRLAIKRLPKLESKKPPMNDEPMDTYTWTSTGGRVVRVQVPRKLGKPSFGGPWVKDRAPEPAVMKRTGFTPEVAEAPARHAGAPSGLAHASSMPTLLRSTTPNQSHG